jgi:NADH-quinone oxidoreductase subunit L
MTVPLILLSVFALTLGFVGIPEEIIGHGRNWFHHFVGHEFPATPLSVPVMLLSALLAVGGLALGWLVYGRKPLAKGQPDPLIRVLGPVHTVLKNKYYFDELYHATVVRGTIGLANVFFFFDNRWVIDPIVNLVGRIGRGISELSAAFDLRVIDGLVDLAGRTGAGLSSISGVLDLNVVDRIVDGLGEIASAGGRSLRRIQTGRVQNYLLVVLTTLLVLLGIYIVYW